MPGSPAPRPPAPPSPTPPRQPWPMPGAIPITTASDEARKLYLEGRALAEQLRAHDARKLFEQAAAKDPAFAMAHYQLAANSATAKEFLAHLNEAVALSDQGLRRRAADDPGARGGRQRQPGQGAGVPAGARRQVSRRRAGALPPRRRATSASRSSTRRSSSTEGDRDQPELLAGLQLARLRLPPQSRSTPRRRRRSRSTSS